MKDKKKENKICFILYTITSLIFTSTGITILATNGFDWHVLTNIALAVTFGSVAFMYFKKYKEEK